MIRLRLALIILAMVVMGGGIFFMGLHTMYDDHRLNSSGKSATVMRVVAQTAGNADEVHFKDQNDEEQSVMMVVPMDVQARLNQRQPVSIDYLPNDIKVNRWTGEKRGLGFLTLSGLGILAAGLYLLLRMAGK